MNLVPNAIHIYVSEMERSTAFYESIFDIKPVFSSPEYVAYGMAPGVGFALWSRRKELLAENPPRTFELGLNINLKHEELDALHAAWVAKGAETVEAPYNDVFGYTFVVADPDGNLIRVAPED